MTATSGTIRFTVPRLLEDVGGADHDHTEHDAEPATDTLLVANRALRAGFVLLPRAVLHAPGLSRDARLLYAVLLSYAWQQGSCFPSYQRLKADLGCGINQITRYLRELEGAGLVTRRRRGLGQSTVYTLHDPATASAGEPPAGGGRDDRLARTHRISDCELTESVKPASPVRRHEYDSGEYQADQHHPLAPPPTDGDAHTGAGDDDVLAALTEHGVSERIAVRLVKSHGTQAVKEQLAWHPYRPTAKSPTGALVQAIRERWPAPPAWLEAKEHEAAVARQREEDAARQAEDEARRRDWEARPPEERIAGRLTFWVAGRRRKRQEPTAAEIEAKRAELLAQIVTDAPSLSPSLSGH